MEMKRILVKLSVCVLTAGTLLAGTGHQRVAAAVEPDAAYCPYGFVQGTGSWSPPMTSALLPHSLSLAIQAQCTGSGDESGTYTVTLSGTSTENCAGGTGGGSVAGSSPEGGMSGSFSFYKVGVHYYINGSYASAGEAHALQLWLDVVPPIDVNGVCLYSVASLIGHGAFVDETFPSVEGDTGGIVFAGATGSLNPPVGLLPVNGTYTFSSSICAAATAKMVGTCFIAAAGSFASISCGTGTTGGAPLGHSDSATISGSGTISVSYGIVFVAGVGTLEGATTDGETASGSVNITPTGGDCVNGVTQFTAAGNVSFS